MEHHGAYPALTPTDPVATTPLYTVELAQLLDLPDPVNTSTSGLNVTLSSGVSSWTVVPGLVTPSLYLDTPTLCRASVTGYASGTADAFHYLRLRIRDGEGAITQPSANGVIHLWRIANRAAFTLSWTLRMAPGSVGCTVGADYRTPSSTSASLDYLVAWLEPIRPVA